MKEFENHEANVLEYHFKNRLNDDKTEQEQTQEAILEYRIKEQQVNKYLRATKAKIKKI